MSRSFDSAHLNLIEASDDALITTLTIDSLAKTLQVSSGNGITVAATGEASITGSTSSGTAVSLNASGGGDAVVTSASGNVDVTAGGNLTMTGLGVSIGAFPNTGSITLTSNIDSGGFTLQNLPAEPNDPGDAASKQFVIDSMVGLQIITASIVATNGEVLVGTYAPSGLTISYNGTNAPANIDGITFAQYSLQPVLFKDQTDGWERGVYELTSGDATNFIFTRVTDANSGPKLIKALTYVEQGTVNDGINYYQETAGPIDLQTTVMVWVVFNKQTPPRVKSDGGLEIDLGTDELSIKIDAEGGPGSNTIATSVDGTKVNVGADFAFTGDNTTIDAAGTAHIHLDNVTAATDAILDLSVTNTDAGKQATMQTTAMEYREIFTESLGTMTLTDRTVTKLLYNIDTTSLASQVVNITGIPGLQNTSVFVKAIVMGICNNDIATMSSMFEMNGLFKVISAAPAILVQPIIPAGETTMTLYDQVDTLKPTAVFLPTGVVGPLQIQVTGINTKNFTWKIIVEIHTLQGPSP